MCINHGVNDLLIGIYFLPKKNYENASMRHGTLAFCKIKIVPTKKMPLFFVYLGPRILLSI